jgi:CBS domain-containing protein
MLEYRIIDIFTSEEARWNKKPLSDAIVQYVATLKIAARCIVTRGTDGCYEGGEIATRKLEVLSYNMPVYIRIIVPTSEYECVISDVEKMVQDGIISYRDLNVVAHRTMSRIIPAQIRVKDAMTLHPKTVSPATRLSEVAQLLLSSNFTGIPVVDEGLFPVGIITQGDLIYRGGMPLRLGLLAASSEEKKTAVLKSLNEKLAKEIMSQPVVTVLEDKLLTESVELMLRKKLKRLPVVNSSGRIVGILSRMDLFRIIMRETPDWKAFKAQDIEVGALHFVSDIMRTDTHAVLPRTSLDEVMQLIHANDLERVAVVDEKGLFLGLISDRDLLARLLPLTAGIWDFLISKLPFTERGRRYRKVEEQLQAKAAFEIMDTRAVTIREDASVDEAIGLMYKQGLKRLPVIDSEGKFKGMISRESLLSSAFDCQNC